MVKTENCLYIYLFIYMVRAHSVYIHPAPFVRDAIFPHCMLVHVTTERLNTGDQRNRDLNGEEREARLARWRLIINMLHNTAAYGECRCIKA